MARKCGTCQRNRIPKSSEARPLDAPGHRRPPEERGDGAGHRADEQRGRGAALERRVDEDVAHERERREQAGERRSRRR